MNCQMGIKIEVRYKQYNNWINNTIPQIKKNRIKHI